MKQNLFVLTLLLFLSAGCQKSNPKFPELRTENLDHIDFSEINNADSEKFGNYSLDWKHYKYATTKFVYPTTDTINQYEIDDILNRQDAENLIANFEKTARVAVDQRGGAPYLGFDIFAVIETPKKFYLNYRKIWGGDIQPQYNQKQDLLNFVSFNFKREDQTHEVEFPADSYDLKNEKNEKLTLAGFHWWNMGKFGMDFEEVQNGKEYTQFKMPNFTLGNDSVQQSFTKLKGHIDFEIAVPYAMDIIKVTKKDVGSTITINGVKVDILAFDDNVVHIKLDKHTDVDNKFTIFSKYAFDSEQYSYAYYKFLRENPNLKLDKYLELLSKKENTATEFGPYVFVIYFKNKIDELKLIAKRNDKILQKKVRVNVDFKPNQS